MNTEFDRYGLFSRAVAFAAYAHDKRTRPGTGLPCILHPMETAAIAGAITNDPEVLAAAVLHDVMEDCGITEAELRLKFSKRVAALVSFATEEKLSSTTGEWQRRKLYTINGLRAANRDQMILVLADKLSNLRSIRRDLQTHGDALWQRFNQPNKTMHRWYFTSILEGLEPLSGCEAYFEYKALLEVIFG